MRLLCGKGISYNQEASLLGIKNFPLVLGIRHRADRLRTASNLTADLSSAIVTVSCTEGATGVVTVRSNSHFAVSIPMNLIHAITQHTVVRGGAFEVLGFIQPVDARASGITPAPTVHQQIATVGRNLQIQLVIIHVVTTPRPHIQTCINCF